jgi:hypothetical protein
MSGFDPQRHIRRISGRGGGGEYLDVKWRLVWFRDVFPLGSIATECLYHDADRAFFKATIRTNAIKDGETLVVDLPGSATGHGSETKQDFPDYVEKAETKAIGRALAHAGFGTQFIDGDADEAIADSPVSRPDPKVLKDQMLALGGRLGWTKEDVLREADNLGFNVRTVGGVEQMIAKLQTFVAAEERAREHPGGTLPGMPEPVAEGEPGDDPHTR